MENKISTNSIPDVPLPWERVNGLGTESYVSSAQPSPNFGVFSGYNYRKDKDAFQTRTEWKRNENIGWLRKVEL